MSEFLSPFGIRLRSSEQRLGPGDLVRLLLGKPVLIDVEAQYVVGLRLGWRARRPPVLDLDTEFFSGKSAFELTERDTYLAGVSDIAAGLGISAGHVRATAMWLRLPLASPHPGVAEGPYEEGAVLRTDVAAISASIEKERKK